MQKGRDQFSIRHFRRSMLSVYYRSAKLLRRQINKHVSAALFGFNWCTRNRTSSSNSNSNSNTISKHSGRGCHDDDDDRIGVANSRKLSWSTSRTLSESGSESSQLLSGSEDKMGVGVRATTTTVDGGPVAEDHIRMAEIIWDYMQMHHNLSKSDLILVLGNNDVRVAEHAARLLLDGYAEYILISGHLGNLTEGYWTRSEYEVFREVALNMGVPSDRILVETKATNTGQNVRLSYEVLRNAVNGNGNGVGVNETMAHATNLLPLESIILVQTPYMERRTYATFMKQWPEDTASIRVQVTSPKLYLRQYSNAEVGSLHDVICIMLGCFQRILLYPSKGYQIHQDVPDNVANAYNGLADTGLYGKFLYKS